ncbi:MAG: helix-turn-helix transcriptional regulator [Planctomycetota bacterium]
MALLAREETHGYRLVQQLQTMAMFVDSPPDVSGVYKQLKMMQDEGLADAVWETGNAGPAKRRYSLTDDGRACLRLWAKTLARHRSQIDALLEIIGGQTNPIERKAKPLIKRKSTKGRKKNETH